MVTIDSGDRLGPPPISDPTRMSIGQVFGDMFRVVGRAWPYLALLTLLTALVGLPVTLWQADLQAKLLEHPGQPMSPAMLAQYKSTLSYTIPVAFLQALLGIFAFAAISDGTNRVLDGEGFGFGRAVKTGLVRFFPVLGSAFFFYLMFLVGFIVIVAPGVWVGSVFGLGPSLAVIERRGPFSSLSRSKVLTYGNRWRTIGATLILTLALLAVAAIRFGAVKLVGAYPVIWISWFSSLVTLPFLYVFPTAMAVQLKRLKEGGATSQVAGVF